MHLVLMPCLVAVAMFAAPSSGQATRHDHGQAQAEGHAVAARHVVATPGHRWATDAPLRAGMRGIRNVIEALGHYEHGHIGPDEAVLLARQIEEHIDGIVANCRLDPAADAALHGLLAALAQGASALAEDPADLSPLPSMRQALADYARIFDDPAFEPTST